MMQTKNLQSDNELLALALKLQGHGQTNEATQLFRELTIRHPQNCRLCHLAGSAELVAGNFTEAVALFKQSLAIDPGQADTFCNLGVAFWNLRDLSGAESAYLSALGLNPDYAEALNNLCLVVHELDRPNEALALVEKAIAINPEYADAFNNRGNALQSLERFEDAVESYARAISINPDNASAHNNRGNALRKLNCFSEALDAYLEAIRLKPDYAEAFCNMGCAFEELGHSNDARLFYKKSLALNPDFGRAYFNLGNLALYDIDSTLVLDCFDRSISLNPQFADAHWNKALYLLRHGNFKEGFALYEWGRKAGLRGGDRGFKQNLWLGKESLLGKRLLIHHEQGIGDCIQFARYIPLAVAQGAEVILETVPSLIPLLKTLPINCNFVAIGDSLPDFDYYTPLMSLPYAFGTTLDNMPPADPYLSADPVRSRVWQHNLGPRSKPRIGLVWSGSKLHKNDRNRSLGIKEFLPLLSLPFEFHCLQKEIREEDDLCLPALPMIATHDEKITDFADTAALVAQMDCVVTVDTSVAHLAGALGKPVWILLPVIPDWRWLLSREDSPWYPCAKLFRQDSPNDWDGSITGVRHALIQQFLRKD